MSYILEALKKAEQKSEKGGVPTLLSHPRATDRKSGRTWLYPLIAILFLNAGTIFWWIHPWWLNEPQTIVQAPAVRPQASVAAAEPITKIREPSRSNNLQEVPGEMPITVPRADVPRKGGQDAPLSDTRKIGAIASTSGQPQPRPEKRATPQGRLLSLAELPSAVRKSLPEFKVSGHAYSPEPASRVARINDQIVQEGQSLAPGLKVEEITPSGIVLGYQGYRFQIGINVN